jgi:ABC-type transporter Mla MlaB component
MQGLRSGPEVLATKFRTTVVSLREKLAATSLYALFMRLENQAPNVEGRLPQRLQNCMALRISKGNTSDHTLTLSLEGSVMGPWVAVLETACEEALSNGDQLTLDLGSVSFIDSAGIAVLRTYIDRAIKLVNCSRFTSMQLQGNSEAMHDGPRPK